MGTVDRTNKRGLSTPSSCYGMTDMGPDLGFLVELRGLEPLAFSLREGPLPRLGESR
jgi:hypothetical protein